MKWILCALFLSIGGYFFLSSGKEEILSEAEVSDIKEQRQYKPTIGTRGPARVVQLEVYNGPQDYSPKSFPDFDPSEGENHFKSLLETDEDEAMVYLRRILLRSKAPAEDKVEFFRAALTYLPKEEVTTICRLVINGNTEPELYIEAMKVQLKDISPNERESYLRQRYEQTYDKKTKKLIKNIGKALYYDI